MNCFQHEDQDAQGVCTHCGKALCKNCIDYTQGKVYCQSLCATQAHEETWNTIFEVDNLLKRHSHKTVVYIFRGALALFVIGVLAIALLLDSTEFLQGAFFIGCIVLGTYIQIERNLEKRMRKNLHSIKKRPN